MRCPFCGGFDSMVKDSRPDENSGSIRRRRLCNLCGRRFTTRERAEIRRICVRKADGSIEDYDREKLEGSVRIAMRKRPIDSKRYERLLSEVPEKIEATGDRYVDSRTIGELVMSALREADLVAYIRFASVYKNFESVEDFEEFMSVSRDDID